MSKMQAQNENRGQDNEGSKLVPVPIDPATHKLLGSNLAIGARCGMCVHFGNIQHPAYEDVCKGLGILEENIPCIRYEPDYRQLGLAEQPWFAAFAAAMSEMTLKQRHILASLLMKENRTRKAGFMFGETVYIRVFDGEYLMNYRRAIVVSANSKYVYLEGKGGFHAMVFKGSILNAKQWFKKKADLVKANRINDPVQYRHMVSAADRDAKTRAALELDRLEFLEAQMLEATGKGKVIKEKTAPNKGKVKNPRFMDLTELVNQAKADGAALGTIRTRGGN